MNLHTALPIAVGAGVVITGVLAWLTYRPEKPVRRRVPTVPAPDTQGLIQAYGWPEPEITVARPSVHSGPNSLPLNLPVLAPFDPWAPIEEDADGE